MNYSYLKIGVIISFSTAVAAIVIISIRYIIAHPEPKTMVIFVPLILALLGADALVIYLTIRPSLRKLTRLPVVIGITLVLTGGLIAGVTHFIRFIISPGAALLISKVIASLILISSLTACLLILWLFWSLWRKQKTDSTR